MLPCCLCSAAKPLTGEQHTIFDDNRPDSCTTWTGWCCPLLPCSETAACQARIAALEAELAAAAADNSSRLAEQQKAFLAKLEQLRQVHAQQLAAAAAAEASAKVRGVLPACTVLQTRGRQCMKCQHHTVNRTYCQWTLDYIGINNTILSMACRIPANSSRHDARRWNSCLRSQSSSKSSSR